MEWTDSDKEEYHLQRMVIDSTLCSFSVTCSVPNTERNRQPAQDTGKQGIAAE